MLAAEPYYADESVTLYHGDCRELVPGLGLTADCIVADPPYGETSLAWDSRHDPLLAWLPPLAQPRLMVDAGLEVHTLRCSAEGMHQLRRPAQPDCMGRLLHRDERHAVADAGAEREWSPGDSPILPPVPGECYPAGAVPLDVAEPKWRRVTCQERDAVYAAGINGWGVGSSLTDLGGEYGDPVVFTEWWDKATERPVLRDRRWPQLNGDPPDARPCEHYLADEDGRQCSAPDLSGYIGARRG